MLLNNRSEFINKSDINKKTVDYECEVIKILQVLVYHALITFFNLFILVHKAHVTFHTDDDEMQQHETWSYSHNNWYIFYTLSIMYIYIYIYIYILLKIHINYIFLLDDYTKNQAEVVVAKGWTI